MLTAMGDVMREAYARNWITTRDGNISVYRKPHCLYITPSGVRKNKIEVENIIKMHVDDGQLSGPEEPSNPSIEFDMHFKIHEQRGWKTGSVVHLHPTHVVAAMYAGYDLSDIARKFPELSRYTKVGRVVPSFPPGSDDLANYTAKFILDNDIVGQDRHGVTAYALDPWTAFEHIERLDHVCQIVLKSGVK